MRRPATLAHLFRISSLIAPSAIAWTIALDRAQEEELARTVALTLGPLWIGLAIALALRTASVLLRRPNDEHRRASVLARIDLLTGAGAALGWSSAIAIGGALYIGYASLAVVGLLGTAVFHLVALYAFLALRRPHPFAAGSLVRSFSPEAVVEGDGLVESVRLKDVAIPAGYRLFLAGRIGPRWATSRHVVESTESGAELVLESDVGPALRGEHDAEPLSVWLEDVFGLCRSLVVSAGAARLTVLPRARQVDRAVSLKDGGFGAQSARATRRLPTEGAFDLREYRTGDDVRRIHWVRSLAAGELIVRLPDEVPPDRPRVRLILDTYFPEALAMSCAATAEMLDSLVAVWLAVAQAMVEANIKVTLVVPTPVDGRVHVRTLEHQRRNPGAAARLGAQIEWQGRVEAHALFNDEATFVVSRAVLSPPPADPKYRWILVPPVQVTEPVWNVGTGTRTPFPLGHRENSLARRKRAIKELTRAREEHYAALRAIQANVAPPPPGSLAATPLSNGVIRLVRLS